MTEDRAECDGNGIRVWPDCYEDCPYDEERCPNLKGASE